MCIGLRGEGGKLVDLSANVLAQRLRPFFRLWLLVSCIWWAYLSYQYWGYKLPSFDPEPVDMSEDSGGFVPDYGLAYSPEKQAYFDKLAAHDERQRIRSMLLRFSMPFSIPLALWGLAFSATVIVRWVSYQPKPPE